MSKHPTLFITHRGLFHQQAALAAAPAELEITMLRSPSKKEVLAEMPGKEFIITERSGVIDADIIHAGKALRKPTTSISMPPRLQESRFVTCPFAPASWLQNIC